MCLISLFAYILLKSLHADQIELKSELFNFSLLTELNEFSSNRTELFKYHISGSLTNTIGLGS